ncbi:MAG TPA: hypothetical protein VK576_06815 [Thermoleophilia bacterium]|nr:hypothetical protein [Thermoleophilia bacterium]
MSDEPTTVSWKAIEPHWKVYSADDVEIGVVFLPVGDENADIFDGLAITHHGGPSVAHNWLDRPRYVSYDQVASIQPGEVHLTINADQARHLPEHNVPESAEILPENAGWRDRFKTDLEKHTGEDKTY